MNDDKENNNLDKKEWATIIFVVSGMFSFNVYSSGWLSMPTIILGAALLVISSLYLIFKKKWL